MPRPTLSRVTALLAVIALSATACASDPTTTPETDSPFTFGSPAEPADADRVIEIRTTSELVYEPSDISVAAGETVTFRLINEGNLDHDFTLGDQATQDEHEAEMAEMSGMNHSEPNVILVPAGEIAELTWKFGESGMVLIGCHQPGHYAGGMTGQVTIET